MPKGIKETVAGEYEQPALNKDRTVMLTGLGADGPSVVGGALMRREVASDHIWHRGTQHAWKQRIEDETMKLQILLMLGLLGTGATAIAQERSSSPQYHAVHNPNSPNYVGPNQQPAAPQPTGYWEKTWGAIAPSPVGGVLGTALGASSKGEAERIALADCKAKGERRAKWSSPIITSAPLWFLARKTTDSRVLRQSLKHLKWE